MNIQLVTVVAVLPNGNTAVESRHLDIDDTETLEWVAKQLSEVNGNANITVRHGDNILIKVEGK